MPNYYAIMMQRFETALAYEIELLTRWHTLEGQRALNEAIFCECDEFLVMAQIANVI